MEETRRTGEKWGWRHLQGLRQTKPPFPFPSKGRKGGSNQIKSHDRAARIYTGLGKQTLGGHKQKLVYTRTQDKGEVTPQETDPDLPMSVQESLAEVWVSGGLLQGRGH